MTRNASDVESTAAMVTAPSFDLVSAHVVWETHTFIEQHDCRGVALLLAKVGGLAPLIEVWYELLP
jgi:hypothetical protein